MTKYIIKEFEETLYYSNKFGWCDQKILADLFDSRNGAKEVLNTQGSGWYKIEEVYIIN